ncbi:MAG: hypothetical protein HC849_34565, partial [Oscillatoriales cyanobacterium RU_3_3]|nr:hypothetical protein [Oscillatoriales cyanobacterium RU_3_3]
MVSLAIAEQLQSPWLIANLTSIRRKLTASFAYFNITSSNYAVPNSEFYVLQAQGRFAEAEALRFEMLCQSSYQPLAELARKIKGELRYHTMHANYWLKKLGTATEESKARMQQSLNELLPYAVGIFEESEFEPELIKENIFAGEVDLKTKWKDSVTEIISGTELFLSDWATIKPI